jgi:chemotaxis protein methyltransferase CheR
MLVGVLEQDIRHACPQGGFDLSLCRNLVFTYHEGPLQVRLGERLARRLVPGAVLVLGIHESLPESVPAPAQERPWLYRKREE